MCIRDSPKPQTPNPKPRVEKEVCSAERLFFYSDAQKQLKPQEKIKKWTWS
jgi:hypothetical protein